MPLSNTLSVRRNIIWCRDQDVFPRVVITVDPCILPCQSGTLNKAYIPFRRLQRFSVINNKHTIFRFGKLDLTVYNAGSILWEKVVDTPTKRYDLMHDVNARGAYIMVQEVLPHFLKQKSGKIILVAPPIYSRYVFCYVLHVLIQLTKLGHVCLIHDVVGMIPSTLYRYWHAIPTWPFVFHFENDDTLHDVWRKAFLYLNHARGN